MGKLVFGLFFLCFGLGNCLTEDVTTGWSFEKEAILNKESLMEPYQESGKFYNSENEKNGNKGKTSETLAFFKGMVTKSTGIDLQDLVDKDPVALRSEQLKIQWIGHSSFLIQVKGINILVDPVTEGGYPICGINCFKRYTPPGIFFSELPRIDVVLISHNHFDHMEDKTLLFLKKYQPCLLVPQGMKQYFEKKGFKKVFEHGWWDSTYASREGNEIDFYFVPANHGSSSRKGVKKQQSLWGGWVIQSGIKKVYFAGDTSYNEKMFGEIKEVFGHIDVALLPVAPFDCLAKHMDFYQACMAMDVLACDTMIPMHWGAYRFGVEKIEDPYFLMMEEMEKNPDLQKKINLLKIGQSNLF